MRFFVYLAALFTIVGCTNKIHVAECVKNYNSSTYTWLDNSNTWQDSVLTLFTHESPEPFIQILNEPSLSKRIKYLIIRDCSDLSQKIQQDSLSHNKLLIPNEIENATNLKTVYMRSPHVEISGSFKQLANLKTLEQLIISNQVIGFTKELGMLTSLKRLELTNNVIRSLPSEMILLRQLTEVYIADCDVENTEDMISKLITIEFLENLTIKNCGIERVPNSIANLKRLQKVDFSFNSITCIPDGFGDLLRLRFINLEGNKLEASCISARLVNIPEVLLYIGGDTTNLSLEEQAILNKKMPQIYIR